MGSTRIEKKKNTSKISNKHCSNKLDSTGVYRLHCGKIINCNKHISSLAKSDLPRSGSKIVKGRRGVDGKSYDEKYRNPLGTFILNFNNITSILALPFCLILF